MLSKMAVVIFLSRNSATNTIVNLSFRFVFAWPPTSLAATANVYRCRLRILPYLASEGCRARVGPFFRAPNHPPRSHRLSWVAKDNW
ncbi:hypothetical protein L209DRAFT_50961 [Thermothelomyces heterothallicus CBS 203.75]